MNLEDLGFPATAPPPQIIGERPNITEQMSRGTVFPDISSRVSCIWKSTDGQGTYVVLLQNVLFGKHLAH